MTARQKLTLDYETELPAHPVAGQTFNLAAHAAIQLSGTVDPAAAAQAFDPQKTFQPRELAHRIKENMRGWLHYAASEALQQILARPGVDPLAPILDPAEARNLMRHRLDETFGAWTFQIEVLDVTFDVSSSCVAALPDDIRNRLSSLEGEADTAAAFGPFTHVSQLDIEPFPDPLSGQRVRIAAWARAVFTAHPERCRLALDPQGTKSDAALGQELTQAVGPWFDYAVKQACYNVLFQEGRQDPAVLTDDQSMRHHVMALCKEQLAQLGVLHTDIQLNYEAMDQPTAGALRLNLRGMAPTIAADGADPIPMTGPPPGAAPGPAGTPAPIEEAVWRYQKAVMKNQPGIPKKELARQILDALQRDGYSADDRRRVGQLLGADPKDLP